MARRWLVCAGLCAGLGAPAAGAAAEPTLETIMGRLAGSAGLRARFVEVRTVPQLVEPITSHGLLLVAPPDFFARTTDAPEATRLVLDGDVLRVEDAAGALGPAGERGARRVAEEIRAILAGDLAGLGERYDLDFQREPDGWSLSLVPRDEGARRFVERLVLHGQGAEPTALELQEPGGGHAITRFESLEMDRAVSPEERARLAGPPSEP